MIHNPVAAWGSGFAFANMCFALWQHNWSAALGWFSAASVGFALAIA